MQRLLQTQNHMFPYEIRTCHELKPRGFIQKPFFSVCSKVEIYFDHNYVRKMKFLVKHVFHAFKLANT